MDSLVGVSFNCESRDLIGYFNSIITGCPVFFEEFSFISLDSGSHLVFDAWKVYSTGLSKILVLNPARHEFFF